MIYGGRGFCLSVLVAYISCLLSCGGARGEEAVKLGGRLIFGEGSSIKELNLSSRDVRMIGGVEARAFGQGWGQIISLVDANSVLAHDVPPAGGDDHIYEVRIDSGARRIVRTGAAPTFLPARRKIIFFLHERRPTPGYRLYLGDYDRPELPIFKISNETYAAPRIVIPVSDQEVIITPPSNKPENPIFKFNVDSMSVDKLELGVCRPLLWRSATQQLLCVNAKTKDVFFTDLTGSNVESVTLKKNAIPVTYIAKYDTAIFAVPRVGWRGENYDLYALSFTTRKWHEILQNCIIGSGAAIWTE